jgi:hypothetical protein
MATDPLLYNGIAKKVQDQLYGFMEASDITNLFNPISVGDDMLETLAFRFLDKVGRASLSSDLWSPTKVAHDLKVLTMSRYSSGISKDLKYKDWRVLEKMPNVEAANLDAIGKQPGIQAGHYLIQGTQLMDDLTRKPKMADTQYNFVRDVGADNLAGTILRPIGANQVTGTPNTWQATAGAWSTSANLLTDITNGAGSLANKGFDLSNLLCLYPKAASSAMMKKRASAAGDGYINAKSVLADNGISEGRVLAIEDVYGYTVANAAPTYAAFDLLFIDYTQVRNFRTVDPFMNVWIDNTGTKFPEMHIEAGQTFCPIFSPNYHEGDDKWYKGVSIIRAINGT